MENAAQSSSDISDARKVTNVDLAGLRDLSKRLQRRAPAASQQLDSLIDVLGSSSGLETSEWSGVDIFGVFRPSELANILHPHGRRARFLEVVRNLAIFAPLLVTWAHLQGAGSGADFVRDIGQVGESVFYALIAIVVLTLITDWAEHRREHSAAQEEARIMMLLRPVSLRLIGARAGQPHVVIAEFRTMASELRQSMTEHLRTVSDFTRSQQQELDGLQAFRAGLTDEIAALKKAGDGISKAAGKIQTAVDGMDQQMKTLSTQMQESSLSIRQVGGELRGIFDQQSNAIGQMDARSVDLGRAMGQLDSLLKTLFPKMEQMAAVADAIGKVNAEFLRTMSALMIEQKDMTQEVGGAAERMADAVVVLGRIDDAVSAMVQQTKHFSDHLASSTNDTGQVLVRLTESVDVIRESSEIVRDSAVQQDQTTKEFRDAQQDTVELMARIKSFLDASNTTQNDVRGLLQQFEMTQKEFRELFVIYVGQQRTILNEAIEVIRTHEPQAGLMTRIRKFFHRRRHSDGN